MLLSKTAVGVAGKSIRLYNVTPVRNITVSCVANQKASELNPDEKVLSPKLKESNSFCMNLFRGRVNLDQVFPYPLKLNDDRRETLEMILSPTEKFLEEVNDPFKNDEKAEIPKEVLRQFAELGAFGAVVPEEFEGAGLNNTQMARLAEVVGANDLGLGVVMGAHQSIGYKGILLFGTDAQKKKYLPDLATGRKFAAFCLTESTSGSDANSIRSRAEKSECGKFYVIHGGKIWISNGGFADIFTVFAQTPIKQADGSVKDKVSAFIVERAFAGVTSGPPEKKMGIKGSNTAEVHFDNVPVENLLGEEGEGFKVSMNILNNGRFGIPAACTGSMKYSINKTIEHINNRVQFGRKIRDFGNVQEKLTDMILRHYVTESIVYMLASNMDAGVQDYQLEAAIGKVVASENAWYVCDEAIQLHGGMGFMRECGLERVLRDLRIFRIFEGANDVMRLFVALTGMQHAGKHLQQLAKDIKSGSVGALFGEIKRRTIGDIGGDVTKAVDPALKESAALLNEAIKEFGTTVQTLLSRHRREIIERQYELIRVANAAIDIYSMVAVLSRASYVIAKSGLEQSTHDQQIAQLFVRQASKRAMANLKEAATPSVTGTRLIGEIAKSVCDNGAMIQKHPLSI
ncbi:acyl-CoA dehydrogenase, middle domain-containing protein [Ditylenchus destructor]|uniref:Very long-chain specific acyl-CoA dehydrogenase, mitochondrial n=1 Tax=Ditylenchus destructor TaxID=166010 RepID=A0AAD4N7H1_9BILA|nr:acyl-CoA dehydrogenase, middle domain-containing protein [Ditylenchus destructor]